MTDGDAAYVLVVVDGPSKARGERGDDSAKGAVSRLVTEQLGVTPPNLDVQYWHHAVGSVSPRRTGVPRLRGHAEKADRLLRRARTLGRCLCVFVLDADGKGARPLVDGVSYPVAPGLRQLPIKLADLVEWRALVEDSHAVAIGIAVEMIEAWLLADPELAPRSASGAASAETLWGDKHDAKSNYPRHVVRRTVLEPRNWTHADAVQASDADRASENAFWLRAFREELRALDASFSSGVPEPLCPVE